MLDLNSVGRGEMGEMERVQGEVILSLVKQAINELKVRALGVEG